MNEFLTVPLYHAAHGRTGGQGNRSNISVMVWHLDLPSVWVDQLTLQAVAEHFAHSQPAAGQRCLLPQLHAMIFLLHRVLDGDVNDALNLDTHGKALLSDCWIFQSAFLFLWRR